MLATPAFIVAATLLLIPAGVPEHVPQASPSPQQSPTADVAKPTPAAALSDAEMEKFLKDARIIRTKGIGKGVTGSTQATLSDGTLTHDAHIQTIDESQREFRTAKGIEFDFRDSWMFNVAAYRLDRLLDLNLVPVSVAGHYRTRRAAITWWVDDVMTDEGGRLKKKLEPPPDRSRYWNQQIYVLRIFDELIYNTDRNLGNMLISSDWRLWAIDHTRAFRRQPTLRAPAQVSRCDSIVFARLKALDFPTLKRELGAMLDEGQIKAILARRDAIVAKLEALGPTVIFERMPPGVAH